jgi:hypothetical protein
LIEIDPDPTALTDLATVVLRGPAGELLPRLVEAVRARGGPVPYEPVPYEPVAYEPVPHETGSL